MAGRLLRRNRLTPAARGKGGAVQADPCSTSWRPPYGKLTPFTLVCYLRRCHSEAGRPPLRLPEGALLAEAKRLIDELGPEGAFRAVARANHSLPRRYPFSFKYVRKRYGGIQ